MKRVLVGIATYQRPKKLKRCIDSILAGSLKPVSIVVVADNMDYATHEFLLKNYSMNSSVMCLVQQQQSFVIGAWNKVVGLNVQYDLWDAFIGLCDDVELLPNTLENAVNALDSQFPDGDGVIGLAQDCPGRPDYTFKWFGQTLMGRKFIERYEAVGYKICCTFYVHFYQDEEMFQFANSLGKFYCCPEALLHHYHPSFKPEEMDSTHHIVRAPIMPPMGSGPSLRRPTSLLELDQQVFKRRQSEGKLWGKNWDL